MELQWYPSTKVTIGEGHFGFYKEVSLSQGLVYTQTGTSGTLDNVGFVEGGSLHAGVIVN